MYNDNHFLDISKNNAFNNYCKSERVDRLYILALEKETRKTNRRCFFKLLTALLSKAKRKEIDEDFLTNAQSLLSL